MIDLLKLLWLAFLVAACATSEPQMEQVFQCGDMKVFVEKGARVDIDMAHANQNCKYMKTPARFKGCPPGKVCA